MLIYKYSYSSLFKFQDLYHFQLLKGTGRERVLGLPIWPLNSNLSWRCIGLAGNCVFFILMLEETELCRFGSRNSALAGPISTSMYRGTAARHTKFVYLKSLVFMNVGMTFTKFGRRESVSRSTMHTRPSLSQICLVSILVLFSDAFGAVG
mmetsp:Transcript_15398/g.23980  ORF Transcript_15398/g.23980 Transcript_15398/m.23980 type:complete len:151 (-) Transcript_15398:1010-1462(-)